MTISLKTVALLSALTGTLISADAARACGCFTPPDPSVPIVQAGEQIVFAVANNQVTAHIQIQYAGDAKDFGWLLPLPSIPSLDIGSDELFAQLTNRTQPKYRLTIGQTCGGGNNRSTFGGAATPSVAGGAEDAAKGVTSPLVVQDSIGPYDYAVLKADDKAAMLDWLTTNRYFQPAGTDAAVTPYIHTGAYFLALRLRSGKSTGDLQPVVVRYNSDLPMIPIVLTSTAAKPDMGIQVYMLGKGRAIPRNYFHTVINEAAIDWQTSGANYNDVIIRATKEAKDRHTFVTEFAGKSDIMKSVLDTQGRFGNPADLKAITDPVKYVQYLTAHGFGIVIAQSNTGGGGAPIPNFGQVQFPGALVSLLRNYIPMPQSLIDQKISPSQFYAQLDNYLGNYRNQHPNEFSGLDYHYDAGKLTDDVWRTVVTPTLAAAQLFSTFPYLTRLYTTLSPENMSSDPVFSYNPDLEDVSNVHTAVENFNCNWLGKAEGASILTDSGLVIALPDMTHPSVAIGSLPASQRIEMLREQGKPEVVVDNLAAIKNLLGQGAGCSVARGTGAPSSQALSTFFLLAVVVLAARRRRP